MIEQIRSYGIVIWYIGALTIINIARLTTRLINGDGCNDVAPSIEFYPPLPRTLEMFSSSMNNGRLYCFPVAPICISPYFLIISIVNANFMEFSMNETRLDIIETIPYPTRARTFFTDSNYCH